MEEKEEERMIEEKYIYGIIKIDEEKSFEPIEINENGTISIISYQDIGACVGNSPNIEYSSLTRDKLIPYLINHQFIIEKIMKDYTIIPVKFGTMLSDDEEVREVLKRGYEEFKGSLLQMRDKIEIDIIATFNDLTAILKEISEINEIKRFKEEIVSKPSEETLQDRIKIGAMVKEVLDKRKEGWRNQCLDFFKSQFQEFRIHEVMDDEMIFNCAFLLGRAHEAEFNQRLIELDGVFKGKVNFRCIGPLPVYSFNTIEIKKIAFEEIDSARRILGLRRDIATRLQIKKAYHALAFKHHPDKNLDDPHKEERFDKIAKAYELITSYCQKDKCSFRKEDAGDFILVRTLEAVSQCHCERPKGAWQSQKSPLTPLYKRGDGGIASVVSLPRNDKEEL